MSTDFDSAFSSQLSWCPLPFSLPERLRKLSRKLNESLTPAAKPEAIERDLWDMIIEMRTALGDVDAAVCPAFYHEIMRPAGEDELFIAVRAERIVKATSFSVHFLDFNKEADVFLYGWRTIDGKPEED